MRIEYAAYYYVPHKNNKKAQLFRMADFNAKIDLKKVW